MPEPIIDERTAARLPQPIRQRLQQQGFLAPDPPAVAEESGVLARARAAASQQAADPTARIESSNSWRTGVDGASKYDRTLTADDLPALEDFRARQQSGIDKLGNGLVKMAGTALTSALEAPADLIAGTFYAVGKGVGEGDWRFSNFYDNPVSRSLDDFNEMLKEAFPHYYSDYEKTLGPLAQLGTGNFWADKVGGGLGYAGGALLAGLGVGLAAKTAGKLLSGAVRAAGAARETGQAFSLAEYVPQALKALQSGQKIEGAVASTAKWERAAEIVGAMGEAGMEARGAKNQVRQTLLDQALASKGYDVGLLSDEEKTAMLSPDERRTIEDKADRAGNTVYGLNMALLTAGNHVQFGSVLRRSFGAEQNQFSQAMKGLIKGSDEAVTGANLLTRGDAGYAVKKGWARTAATLLKTPVSEATEEQLQLAAEKGVTDYFSRPYDPAATSALGDYFGAVTNVFSHGLKEAYTTREGWENALLGGVVGGLMGGPVRDMADQGRERTAAAGLAQRLNDSGFSEAFKELATHASLQNTADQALKKGDLYSYKNAKADQFFTYAQSRFEAGREADIEDDFKKAESLDDAEFKASYGVEKGDVDFEKLRGAAQSVGEIHRQVETQFPTRNADIKKRLKYYASTAAEAAERENEVASEVEKATGVSYDALRKERLSPEWKQQQAVRKASLAQMQKSLEEAEVGTDTSALAAQLQTLQQQVAEDDAPYQAVFASRVEDALWQKANPAEVDAVRRQVEDMGKLSARRHVMLTAYNALKDPQLEGQHLAEIEADQTAALERNRTMVAGTLDAQGAEQPAFELRPGVYDIAGEDGSVSRQLVTGVGRTTAEEKAAEADDEEIADVGGLDYEARLPDGTVIRRPLDSLRGKRVTFARDLSEGQRFAAARQGQWVRYRIPESADPTTLGPFKPGEAVKGQLVGTDVLEVPVGKKKTVKIPFAGQEFVEGPASAEEGVDFGKNVESRPQPGSGKKATGKPAGGLNKNAGKIEDSDEDSGGQSATKAPKPPKPAPAPAAPGAPTAAVQPQAEKKKGLPKSAGRVEESVDDETGTVAASTPPSAPAAQTPSPAAPTYAERLAAAALPRPNDPGQPIVLPAGGTYLSVPNSDGSWQAEFGRPQHIDHVSGYHLVPDVSGQTAWFEVSSHQSSWSKLIGSRMEAIVPVADEQNAYSPDRTKIVTLEAGEAKLTGGKWVVTKKAKIGYEGGQYPDWNAALKPEPQSPPPALPPPPSLTPETPPETGVPLARPTHEIGEMPSFRRYGYGRTTGSFVYDVKPNGTVVRDDIARLRQLRADGVQSKERETLESQLAWYTFADQWNPTDFPGVQLRVVHEGNNPHPSEIDVFPATPNRTGEWNGEVVQFGPQATLLAVAYQDGKPLRLLDNGTFQSGDEGRLVYTSLMLPTDGHVWEWNPQTRRAEKNWNRPVFADPENATRDEAEKWNALRASLRFAKTPVLMDITGASPGKRLPVEAPVPARTVLRQFPPKLVAHKGGPLPGLDVKVDAGTVYADEGPKKILLQSRKLAENEKRIVGALVDGWASGALKVKDFKAAAGVYVNPENRNKATAGGHAYNFYATADKLVVGKQTFTRPQVQAGAHLDALRTLLDGNGLYVNVDKARLSDPTPVRVPFWENGEIAWHEAASYAEFLLGTSGPASWNGVLQTWQTPAQMSTLGLSRLGVILTFNPPFAVEAPRQVAPAQPAAQPTPPPAPPAKNKGLNRKAGRVEEDVAPDDESPASVPETKPEAAPVTAAAARRRQVFMLYTPERAAEAQTSAEAERAEVVATLPSWVSVHTQERLVDGHAFGAYQDGAIALSEMGPRGRGAHEAYHAFEDLLLTDEEFDALENEWKEKTGQPNLSTLDGMEQRAEAYRTYRNTGVLPEGFAKKKGTLLERLFEKLSELVDFLTGRRRPKDLAMVFEKLARGGYRLGRPVPNTRLAQRLYSSFLTPAELREWMEGMSATLFMAMHARGIDLSDAATTPQESRQQFASILTFNGELSLTEFLVDSMMTHDEAGFEKTWAWLQEKIDPSALGAAYSEKYGLKEGMTNYDALVRHLLPYLEDKYGLKLGLREAQREQGRAEKRARAEADAVADEADPNAAEETDEGEDQPLQWVTTLETNPADRISTALRFLIDTIPQRERDPRFDASKEEEMKAAGIRPYKYVTTARGLPKLTDGSRLRNTLLDRLANTFSLPDMLKQLQALVRTDVGAQADWLLDRLKEVVDADGNFAAGVSLQRAMFVQRFHQAFANAKVEHRLSITGSHSLDQTAYATRGRILERWGQGLRQRIRTSPEAYGVRETDDQLWVRVRDLSGDLLSQFDSRATPLDTPERARAFLDFLGVEISDAQWGALTLAERRIVEERAGDIQQTLARQGREYLFDDLSDRGAKVEQHVKAIADRLVPVTTQDTALSYRSGEGKNRFAINLAGYIVHRVRDWSRGGLPKTEFNQFSQWQSNTDVATVLLCGTRQEGDASSVKDDKDLPLGDRILRDIENLANVTYENGGATPDPIFPFIMSGEKTEQYGLRLRGQGLLRRDNAWPVIQQYLRAELLLADRLRRMRAEVDPDTGKRYVFDHTLTQQWASKTVATDRLGAPSFDAWFEAVFPGYRADDAWAHVMANLDDYLASDRLKTAFFDGLADEDAQIDGFVTGRVKALKQTLKTEGVNLAGYKHLTGDVRARLLGLYGQEGKNPSTKKYFDADAPGGGRFTRSQLKTDAALETYVLSMLQSNMEQQMLLAGSSFFYDDLPKRAAMLQSAKRTPTTDAGFDGFLNDFYARPGAARTDGRRADGTARVGVFGDVNKKISEAFHQDLVKILGQDGANAYLKINEADAQGYISLDALRELKLREATWDDTMESEYRRLRTGGKATGQTSAIFTVQKLQHAALVVDEKTGLETPVFYKLSLLPLLPSMTMDENGAERELAGLLRRMQNPSSPLDIVTFQSGNKGGGILALPGEGQKPVWPTLYDERGHITPQIDERQIRAVSWANFGTQVASQDYRKDEVTDGSQTRKQIINNVAELAQITLGNRKVSGARAMEEYHGIYRGVIADQLAELEEEAGLTERPNGTFVFSEKLLDYLDSQLTGPNTTDNQRQALELLRRDFVRDGKVQLDASLSAEKMEKLLVAMVNRAIKFSRPGDGRVQVAQTGFELRQPDAPSQTDKFNAKYNKGKIVNAGSKEVEKYGVGALKFYQPDSNSVNPTGRMEVLLPHYFKGLPGLTAGEITDPRLLELLAYRIPTEGLASIDAIIVKGFLPPEAGSIIVVPAELTVKSGGDFDVDKLWLCVPHVRYDKKTGLPEYIDENTKPKAEEATDPAGYALEKKKLDRQARMNALLRLEMDLVLAPERKAELLSPNSSGLLEKAVADLHGLRGTETRGKIKGWKLLAADVMAEVRSTMLAARRALGQAALHGAHHALAQRAGTTLPSKGLENRLAGLHVKKEGKSVRLRFDRTRNTAGGLISRLLAQFNVAYVDAGKNPFIVESNIYGDMTNPALTLARAGLPETTLVPLFAQPALVELHQASLALQGEYGGGYSGLTAMKKAVEAARKSWGGKLSEAERKAIEETPVPLTEGELRAALDAEKPLSAREKASIQYRAILAFDAALAVSKNMQKLMTLTSQDKPVRSSLVSLERRTSPVLDEQEQNTLLPQRDQLLATSFLGAFHAAQFRAAKFFKDAFVTLNRGLSPGYWDDFNGLVKGAGNEAAVVKAVSRLRSTALTTALREVEMDGVKLIDLEGQLLYGRGNSVGDRLVKAKKEFRKRGIRNRLVEELVVEFGKKKTDPNVIYLPGKVSPGDQNALTDDWRTLVGYRDEDEGFGQAVRSLGRDLFAVAILQHGLMVSPKSLVSLAPAELYHTLGRTAAEALQRKSLDLDQTALADAFRFNAMHESDRMILPQVHASELRAVRGGRYESSEYFGYGVKRRAESSAVDDYDGESGEETPKLLRFVESVPIDEENVVYVYEQVEKLGQGWKLFSTQMADVRGQRSLPVTPDVPRLRPLARLLRAELGKELDGHPQESELRDELRGLETPDELAAFKKKLCSL